MGFGSVRFWDGRVDGFKEVKTGLRGEVLVEVTLVQHLQRILTAACYSFDR
jgi:hypothetical protein